jgi:hypothetical protein
MLRDIKVYQMIRKAINVFAMSLLIGCTAAAFEQVVGR